MPIEFTDEAELTRLSEAYELLWDQYKATLATAKQHSDGGTSITNYELAQYTTELTQLKRAIIALKRKIKQKNTPGYIPVDPNKRSGVLRGDLC